MGIKKTVLAVVAILVMMTATCFAQITKEDLNIGGIYIGQPLEEVVAKYGDSVRKEPHAPKGYDLIFMIDGSEIRVFPIQGQVVSFSLNDNSKLNTSAGISIGMSLDDIKNAYGNPDKVTSDMYVNRVSYFTPNVYSNDANSAWEYYKDVLTFNLSNGRIKFITFDREYKYKKEFIMP